MVGDYRRHTMEELYALMERDRIAAAGLAADVFQNDVAMAVTTIAEINAVACARVQADTQVASAKMLIDAEVVAVRLSANAEAAISEYKRLLVGGESRETVSAMIKEINRRHSAEMTLNSKTAIEGIERDAAAAITKLKAIGAAALDDIHCLAKEVSWRVEDDAKLAAEKLATYRQTPHSAEEAVAEADQAAKIVREAAEESSRHLQRTLDAAIRNITATADEACANVAEASKRATERILAALDEALRRVQEVVDFGLR